MSRYGTPFRSLASPEPTLDEAQCTLSDASPR